METHFSHLQASNIISVAPRRRRSRAKFVSGFVIVGIGMAALLSLASL
ncbi:MAG: hypothetical protein VW948_06820 [Burkholderiaceae bacterium]